MKHLQLFEDHNNDIEQRKEDLLFKAIMNGIINNKKVLVDRAIQEGFDVRTRLDEFLKLCFLNNIYDLSEYDLNVEISGTPFIAELETYGTNHYGNQYKIVHIKQPVNIIDNALDIHNRTRDDRNLGSSEFSGTEIFYMGKPFAKISYNGRVWEYKLYKGFKTGDKEYKIGEDIYEL